MKTKFLVAIIAFVFISCGGSSSDSYYPSSEHSGGTGGSNVSFKSKYTKTGKKVNLYNYNWNWFVVENNVDVYTDGYNYYIRDYTGAYNEIYDIISGDFGYDYGFRNSVFWGASLYYFSL